MGTFIVYTFSMVSGTGNATIIVWFEGLTPYRPGTMLVA